MIEENYVQPHFPKANLLLEVFMKVNKCTELSFFKLSIFKSFRGHMRRQPFSEKDFKEHKELLGQSFFWIFFEFLFRFMILSELMFSLFIYLF